MRKLNVDDVYLLSKIVDKMDFELPEVTGKGEEAQSAYGMKIMTMLLKKMHKAKDEINELILSVTGKNPKEMSLKDLGETFKGILSQEGVMEVFK